MKILAVDPGYERLGVAVLEKNKNTKELLLYSACIQTSKDLEHHERLAHVSSEVQKIIKKFSPEALAIETLFFSKNQKTALKVAEARGTVLATASLLGLDIFELRPNDIKVAVTGYGKSDKQHIISMVPKLISVSKEIKFDDEYDAIATGLAFFALKRALSTE